MADISIPIQGETCICHAAPIAIAAYAFSFGGFPGRAASPEGAPVVAVVPGPGPGGPRLGFFSAGGRPPSGPPRWYGHTLSSRRFSRSSANTFCGPGLSDHPCSWLLTQTIPLPPPDGRDRIQQRILVEFTLDTLQAPPWSCTSAASYSIRSWGSYSPNTLGGPGHVPVTQCSFITRLDDVECHFIDQVADLQAVLVPLPLTGVTPAFQIFDCFAESLRPCSSQAVTAPSSLKDFLSSRLAFL